MRPGAVIWGVAELLPFFGKSEAYTVGKGGPPPPLRGWSLINEFCRKPVAPIPEFFRPKVRKVSLLQESSIVVPPPPPGAWPGPRSKVNSKVAFWGAKFAS